MKPPGLGVYPVYPVTKCNQNGIPLLPSHRTGSVGRRHLTEIQRDGAGAEGRGKGSAEARELSGRSEYRGDLVLEGREREKGEANSWELH